MRGSEMPRLWLMRFAQMPLAYSAPHDCLQYYTADNGTIQTFNFAINGRHLAGQDYKACVRKNTGKCGVRYSPCDNRSFRIGPGKGTPEIIDPAEIEPDSGVSGGPDTGSYGPDGQNDPSAISTTPRANITGDQQMEESQNGSHTDYPLYPECSMQQMPVMPANEIEEIEGSGADPQMASVVEDPVRSPSLAARIWSFIWPSWLWGQRSMSWGWSRWSPYAQHYVKEDDKLRYYGYGNFGASLLGYGRKRCTDRITIPCENEYFISSTSYIPGVCDPHHCGNTFCPGVGNNDCRVETSISPFAVSVHFGTATSKRNPEENIGACLRYTQLPCDI
ncbi:unnamed protein product [Diatraea saccharalis]|uniref:CUB domain-containing protein n=1 Tax=Diatraea saccharalis TaxID=40085 RepID=A0A9N9R2W4_9NEOP|nr:unnamed protein product [Diatraea saccharalis]